VTIWKAKSAIFGGEATWISAKSIGLTGKRLAKQNPKGGWVSKT
jgi:hypothetical protein